MDLTPGFFLMGIRYRSSVCTNFACKYWAPN
jgi:hypothetical protein